MPVVPRLLIVSAESASCGPGTAWSLDTGIERDVEPFRAYTVGPGVRVLRAEFGSNRFEAALSAARAL